MADLVMFMDLETKTDLLKRISETIVSCHEDGILVVENKLKGLWDDVNDSLIIFEEGEI